MNKKDDDIPIIKIFTYGGNYYVYDTNENQLLNITREHYMEVNTLLRLGIAKYKNLESSSKKHMDILMLIKKVSW